MTMFSIPLWYHPTTVLFLDDDRVFLDFLLPHIDPGFSVVAETDPLQGLEILKKRAYDVGHLLKSVTQQNFDDSLGEAGEEDTQTYNLDLSVLRKGLKRPEHFGRSVVVVLDRHMPAMDGLEFCKKIRKEYAFPVKLILLTGATRLDEAVQAFNDGKIDAYVQKRATGAMIEQVNSHIKALAWSQFQEMSRLVVGSFGSNFTHLFTPAFSEEFAAIREREGTIEFYLLNISGSFLLLDRAGQAKVLLVCSEEDFETIQDVAEDSDAPADVLEAVRSRQQYPLLLSQKIPSSLGGNAWRDVMVTVKQIKGQPIFCGVAPYS